jgi:hypothetical protein
MQQKNYWVGDRPGGSWTFQVLNQRSGVPESLAGYSKAKVILIDSDNRQVEIPDVNTAIADAQTGQVVFVWPQDSLFTKPGRYTMQLELSGGSNGAVRKTTVQEILVRESGGVTK